MLVLECNLHRLSCLDMGQREKKRKVGGKQGEHEGGGAKSDRFVFCSVPSFSSTLSVSPLLLYVFYPFSLSISLHLPDLCGHCGKGDEGWGCLTGACSSTVPVTQGEEWPLFPLSSLSSTPGRPLCLFVFPDIRRHLNSPVEGSTMHKAKTNG